VFYERNVFNVTLCLDRRILHCLDCGTLRCDSRLRQVLHAGYVLGIHRVSLYRVDATLRRVSMDYFYGGNEDGKDVGACWSMGYVENRRDDLVGSSLFLYYKIEMYFNTRVSITLKKRLYDKMAAQIECQICFESFHSNKIDKVACGSSVDHMVCFDCEKTWRSKMALKDGIRIMKCPTCRQDEQYRTTASLQREAASTSSVARTAAEEIMSILRRNESVRMAAREATREAFLNALANAERANAARIDGTREAPVVLEARPVGPQRARCESGRNCRSTSQSGRSMTHLKCRHCDIVFCCRNCSECVRCRPYPSYQLPFAHQIGLV